MCLGIPGQIESIGAGRADLATVTVGGARRTINVALVQGGGLRPGDWVLIHVGFALSKIDEREAEATLALLADLGREESDPLAGSRAE